VNLKSARVKMENLVVPEYNGPSLAEQQ
jgi:hypothetical protein